jgi:hypothetical protein
MLLPNHFVVGGLSPAAAAFAPAAGDVPWGHCVMELATNQRREMQVNMNLCLAVQPKCVWWDEGVGRQDIDGSILLGAPKLALSPH